MSAPCKPNTSFETRDLQELYDDPPVPYGGYEVATASLVLTSLAGGLFIGLLCAVVAVLVCSPILLALALVSGPKAGLSVLCGIFAAVGWPAAVFSALQLAQVLAVAATSRLARRWVAALTVLGVTGAVLTSARPMWAGAVGFLTLAAGWVSLRLESGLGPLSPSLKVPPGPGV